MNGLGIACRAKLAILWAVLVMGSMQGAVAQQATSRSTPDTKVRQASSLTPLPKPKSDALASSGQSYARKGQEPRSSASSGLLGSFFALGIVLAVFLGFTFLVRRAFPSMVRRRMPREIFEVIASSEVQPKQTWMLMRFGNKLLLVCQQPGETRLISEITDQLEVQRIVALCEKPHPSDTALESFSWQSLLGNQRSATG